MVFSRLAWVDYSPHSSWGNKFRFWQIFVEALEEFPNLFIQSETSASTHEYSESNRASKYVMLLSNFGDEHRGLSPASKAGFRCQLVLVLPTMLFISSPFPSPSPSLPCSYLRVSVARARKSLSQLLLMIYISFSEPKSYT